MTTSLRQCYAQKANHNDVLWLFIHAKNETEIYTCPKWCSIRATRIAEEPGLDYQCHFTDGMSAENAR
ncbi:hypothetical protein ACISK3_08540 [Morganella morganii]